jgi:Zn-dependent metalloprotease
MAGFEELHYHVADEDPAKRDVGARAPTLRGAVPGEAAGASISFNSDEDAARFYVDAFLRGDDRPAMRGVLAPEQPQKVPDLNLIDARESPLTNTRVVRFSQTREAIPIFGGQAVVELTPERDVVSLRCSFGDVRDVPTTPSLTPAEAVERVADFAGPELDAADLPAPALRFFHDSERDSWSLAWLVRDVPAAPPEVSAAPLPTHGLGSSPRDESRVDYLIDAHYGTVLFYYSAAPTIDVPTLCRGTGEDGVVSEFWGRLEQDRYEMADPLRNTRTFDLGYQDLRSTPLPSLPIAQSSNDWGSTNKAAVSAHVNAMRVHDFYKSVLQRNGIDDGGMDLISVVNSTYGQPGAPPVWANAVWHNGKMWYGQTGADQGSLVSMSRFLDVIAHELTHGVIDFSSQLVYKDESGALNESFCDIFGVIVKNWYFAPVRADVATWDWELGSGFRGNGKPLRDLSDPTRTDDPDHYEARYVGTWDYGGVHTNSNIHNKAAYNLLTATDEAGKRAFSVDEAVVLYYLCMVRLYSLATFQEALRVLTDVAKTYFAGNPALRDRKVAAITSAYAAVGIT